MLAIYRQQQRLDELFSRVKDVQDLELQSHWCRYLCVLTCGFLENSVEISLSEYSRRRSDDNIGNYVQAKLSGFQNPKMGAILDLFGSFNPEWKVRLDQATQGQLSDSVNSIVGNRHKIAHGDSVSLSLSSLKAYYKDALKVVTIICSICEP
jgi:hypothetical protein